MPNWNLCTLYPSSHDNHTVNGYMCPLPQLFKSYFPSPQRSNIFPLTLSTRSQTQNSQLLFQFTSFLPFSSSSHIDFVMDPPTPIPTNTATAAASAAAASASVQHVTKRSSDELLRKFADSCNEAEASVKKKAARAFSKQRKRSRKSSEFDQGESLSDGKSSSLVERRSLLPVVAGTKNKGLLLRQLRVHGRSRDIRNKSLFGTIHKTWRRTIEGASKVFMEKHYNKHRRLINDIV